ncbi:hypothetical protein [Halodesulfovibrio marinisediminis]|uniref:Uncharacterized protein n=1 Tax=Halodesulfovibrio marinisediminis DSM 17456 TaxID=1121457 RepID=A0A1N6I268_9BACT|nr:hypothetical protein [Halodesulfovibrio marinisediminis]SIO25975.1 hypothetical protein SAMN02745161_2347 [Halodesulfovibrio marinisediminis DSM 17456]
MSHLFILLIMYAGIGLFVLKHVMQYSNYHEAFFPGITLGIIATIIHVVIRQSDQKKENKEDQIM